MIYTLLYLNQKKILNLRTIFNSVKVPKFISKVLGYFILFDLIRKLISNRESF